MNDLDIKNIRKKIGVSQESLAKMIGVHPRTVQNWEAGGAVPKSKYTILRDVLNGLQSPSDNNLEGNGVPFYENLPVSAGQADLIHITQGEHPTGYISLPGVRAIAAFPVVGCSMEPEIKPGDFIAVTPMDNLETIDPDKTYMIITHDDRMIKHLHPDNDDSDILWASSPNYPKFRLRKSDITALYRINFHGRIL